MQLSPHFTLSEFCTSQTAARLGISNDPPLEVVAHLKRTAEGLERVRGVLDNNAIHINSGYRCEELERVLTYTSYLSRCRRKNIPVNESTWDDYFGAKSHPKGEAADFICPTWGTPDKIMRAIVDSAIDYDQIINEFGAWIHISFSDKSRRQALVIDHSGTRAYEL